MKKPAIAEAPFRTFTEVGKETFRLFRQVIEESVSGPVDGPFQRAGPSFAAEFDRFKIWAIDLGLLVPGHGSLDYRVREAESLAKTLQTFLVDLNQSLAEVLERVRNLGVRQSDDTLWKFTNRGSIAVAEDLGGFPDSQSDIDDTEDSDAGSESDMELLLDSVNDIIDRLYKLSVKLRNPSTRLASSKAQNFQQIDEESGADLLQIFEHYDYDYVRSIFFQYNSKNAKDTHLEQSPVARSAESQDDLWHPQTTCVLCKARAESAETAEEADEEDAEEKQLSGEEVGEFLLRRIAHANVRRRQQFGYWKNHRDKLARHTQIAIEPPGPPAKSPEEVLRVPTKQTDNGHRNTMLGLGESLSAPSVTTASRLQPALLNLDDSESTITVSEYAPSTWDPSKESVNFPEPPKRVFNKKFFLCPYCFTTCPNDVLSTKAWKAHLIHDLRPYICTYRDCKSANQLYDTRRDWIQHENSFHRKSWRCPEHSDLLFLTVEAFGEHIKRQHSDDIDAMSTESSLRACETVSLQANRACPICLLHIESARSLANHIALHLERIAIFSLPRSTDDDGSEKEEMGSENANFAAQESRDGDFGSTDDVRGEQRYLHPATMRLKSAVRNIILQSRVVNALKARVALAAENGHDNVGHRVQVIEAKKRVLGEEHPDTLFGMTNLALIYRVQGRWAEAEVLQAQVVETRRRVLGEENPDTLSSIADLATTYWNQGRWTEAERLEIQVVETRKRVLGEEHPDTLTSMANLASTYWNQGRWTEAERLQIQIMETRKRVLGEEHPDTLTSIANLASTYSNQGRWTEAERLQIQIMETMKRVLGEEHPDTLTSMANLASTYWNQGRWTEAERLQIQIMETMKRVLGEEHPDTLTSMANLASTYWNQGRWTEAERLQIQIMETMKRVLGEEHPDTLTSMANLASTYWNQGRWTEAERLEIQIMETMKRVLGEEHPDTLTSMANLASTYSNQGRWTEAERLQIQVVETRKRVLGEEHPSTLNSIANLSSTYSNQGRWTEAERLQIQVVETMKRVLGEEHLDTLTSMHNLAFTIKGQDRNGEAVELMAECVQLRNRVLGAEHPYALSSAATLAEWQNIK